MYSNCGKSGLLYLEFDGLPPDSFRGGRLQTTGRMGQERINTPQQTHAANPQQVFAKLQSDMAGASFSNAVRYTQSQVPRLARMLPIKRERAEFLVANNWVH